MLDAVLVRPGEVVGAAAGELVASQQRETLAIAARAAAASAAAEKALEAESIFILREVAAEFRRPE